jgi:pteridine reductase
VRPRALVTGANARVGAAIARELAGAGFDLAVHHRSHPEQAEAVRADCAARRAEAFVVQADLATPEGCDAVVGAVAARWDALHLLVNNASVFPAAPFDQVDAAAWDEVLAVNLRAPFLLSRGLLPRLRAADGAALGAPAGQHGVVVHLVDIGADRPVSGHVHYSVSKAGLAMLVKAMAVELAPDVRTVGISPGQVAWPEGYGEARRDRIVRRIPLGRVGAPEDVARLVRFVATEGHYLNGAVVPVDGGLSCRY